VKTNFIHEQGFEKPDAKLDIGAYPGKVEHDKAQVAEKTNDLRLVHFILGKDRDQFGKISSTTIGKSAKTSTNPEEPAWAILKSNFDMGVNKRGRMTDYQVRYMNTFSNAAVDPSERIANKEKLVADAVYIGGNAVTLPPNTMKNYKGTF
jgi:hypothetical protein